MKKQAVNPFLPMEVCIPDGEPHVFGDRVYLYGSHDRFGGSTFCMEPYVIWSAPIDDLSAWSNKGISYEAKQDPFFTEERPYMFAPDCVQGLDGRYYLYYALAGDQGKGGYDTPVSVAVCDTPDGKFQYYGFVKHKDGSVFRDYVMFDPAVINDHGVIRLYCGCCYPFENYPWVSKALFLWKMQSGMFGRSMEEVKRGVMGAVTMELAEDMLTVVTTPKLLLPQKTVGTQWEKHPFFEASSIRRIGDLYYFIYSSQHNHELCYATSAYPDRDFVFRGVIVSNGDIGIDGRKAKDRLNHTGTNHGSIERIGDGWYVFYHRLANNSDFSRQACAEPISILPDGTIKQVEMTSCGLNSGPLAPDGIFCAGICCNLTNGAMPHGGMKKRNAKLPAVKEEAGDAIVWLPKGSKAVYKYFDLTGIHGIRITAKGAGTLNVQDKVTSVDTEHWQEYYFPIQGNCESTLCFDCTEGAIKLLSFCFTKEEQK